MTDDAFDEWVADVGNDIASEIHDRIKSTSGDLCVNNGNHAVWHEGDLAMAFNMEALTGDYENCPVLSHMFSTLSDLIMRATTLLGQFEDEP